MLCSFRWLVVSLLFLAAAFGQPYKQDPVEAALRADLQAFYQLRSDGQYDAAVGKREEARTLLDRLPVTAPNFVSDVQQVTQLCQASGKTAEVRSIIQAALARSSRLGDVHPTRVGLLTALSNSWAGDGSLLKAASILEQAVSAVDGAGSRGFAGDPQGIYQQLANLYRQLGRPQAAEAVLGKLQTRLRDNPSQLASLYESQGRLEEAEAIYRQLADEAKSHQEADWLLESLARVYARDDRPADAASAMQRAIALLQTADPGSRNQVGYLRQMLAGYLQQAGRNDQAEETYRQMLSDSTGDGFQAVSAYANYLGGTQRRGQATKLFADYLDSHSDLPAGQQMNALHQLANLEDDPAQAAEYRRIAGEKQKSLGPAVQVQDPSAEELQQAQIAASQGRFDEAFSLSMHAFGAISLSAKRDFFNFWWISQIADQFASKQPGRADELYQNLLATVEAWSPDTIQPLENAMVSYVRFLSRQPDRHGAALAAIERYQSVVSAARGEDAGARDALGLWVEIERTKGSRNRALFLSHEALRLEESLNGATSYPYLRALQERANLYQQSCDAAQALPLQRQIIAISDLTQLPGDPQRAHSRLNAANLFASQGQFDEAERLVNEATALIPTLRPRPDLGQQIDRIRRSEKAALQNPASAAMNCGYSQVFASNVIQFQ